VRYAWDPEKAASNASKHGIHFSDAVSVFADERALTVEVGRAEEERYVTIGMDAFARILVVVYAWPNEQTIRLISARKATRTERHQYAQEER
jgi:uncharacterized protein